MISIAKRILSVLVMLALAFSLSACGKTTIVGKWNMTTESVMKMEGLNEADLKALGIGSLNGVFEFMEDGDLTVTVIGFGSDQVDNYRYTINESDGILKINYGPEFVYSMKCDYTLERNELTISGFEYMDHILEFERD